MLRTIKAKALQTIGAALLVVAGTQAMAQSLLGLDSNWQEGPVPPPPAFDVGHLATVEMPIFMSLRYGVDPQTIRIDADSVVRYVMVATSPSGARNAVYEGIHCASAQVRTYARSSGTQWRKAEAGADANPDGPGGKWVPLSTVRYALAFARQGACQGAAPASSVTAVLRTLQQSPGRGALDYQ